MEKLKLSVLHTLNPLNVYCRLVDAGIERHFGLVVNRLYEKTVFELIRGCCFEL